MVKRWKPSLRYRVGMDCCAHGGYVTYEDYERDTAELRAEIERLKARELEIAEKAYNAGASDVYTDGSAWWETSDIRKELTNGD
jgi:hypothetical protein